MDKDTLKEYVDKGASLAQIAKGTGKSKTTVRYWLKKYGLRTKYDRLKLNIDSVKNAIESSDSYAQALRKLDMVVTAGNYRRITKIAKENNISLSHFGGWRTRDKRTVPDEELFTVSCNHSHSTVRKRVLDKNLIPNKKCAICGISAMWNEKPLTLRLDHINGNHNDNRLENLRFICPNCDSQLDTYCHKNRKDVTV